MAAQPRRSLTEVSGNRRPLIAVHPAVGAHPAIPYILLVDDDDDDHFLISRLLAQAAVTDKLIRFSSGGTALRFLKSRCRAGTLPWLIVLDVKIPGIGGLDLLAWIRSRRELAAVKVIVLSGGDSERDRAQARELGADAYVTKFPSPVVLRKLLAELLDPSPGTPLAGCSDVKADGGRIA